MNNKSMYRILNFKNHILQITTKSIKIVSKLMFMILNNINHQDPRKVRHKLHSKLWLKYIPFTQDSIRNSEVEANLKV